MKNTIKNTFYTIVWLMLLGLNNVNAINVKATQGTTTWDNGVGGNFIGTIDNILWYLVWLLYFVAVIFTLWGGFQILTAGWDEEKVKKWKTTLMQAVIGLIVIFLASNIITWIVWLWNGGTIVK